MIHQLKEEGHTISEIARRLNMDRKTVRHHLKKGLEPPLYKARPKIGSLLDDYKPYLKEKIGNHPGLTATRLHREISALGYQGSYTLLTDYLRTVRPPASTQFERRFETPPEKQAQVDFARFSTRFRTEPDIERVVWLFSLVLGCSHYLCGQFAWRQTLDTVVRCHVETFTELGGVPEHCLYDRMKTAVLGEPEPGNIVYHPTLIALGAHYGFMPKACKPYRAKTKGKVERPFRYIRHDFFLGKTFNDINDLNEQFEGLGIEVDLSLTSERAIRSLENIIEWRGKPAAIRCNNVTEYIAQALIDRANENQITLLYIQPGKPTQNAYIERINRTVRHERLDLHDFSSVEQAQKLATDWLWIYNDERPNTAVGGIPPATVQLAA